MSLGLQTSFESLAAKYDQAQIRENDDTVTDLNNMLDGVLQAQVAGDWARTEASSPCLENNRDKALRSICVNGKKTIFVGRPTRDISGVAFYNNVPPAMTLPGRIVKFSQYCTRIVRRWLC